MSPQSFWCLLLTNQPTPNPPRRPSAAAPAPSGRDGAAQLDCEAIDAELPAGGVTPTVVMVTTVGRTTDANKAALQKAAAATWAVQRPGVHVRVAVDSPSHEAGGPFSFLAFREPGTTLDLTRHPIMP